jgi:hypothetical protein
MMELALTPHLSGPEDPHRWPWQRRPDTPAPTPDPDPTHDDLVRQLDERLTTVERRTDEIDRLIQAELAMHRRKPGAP